MKLTDRQRDRHRESEIQREPDTDIFYCEGHRPLQDRHSDRQAGRQSERDREKTDRETDKQRERYTESLTLTYFLLKATDFYKRDRRADNPKETEIN